MIATMAGCCIGILMVLWSYGPVVLWSCGPMVLWSDGSVVLRSSCVMFMRSYVPVSLCGCVCVQIIV